MPEFVIEPFERAGSIRLGITKGDLEQIAGTPASLRRNFFKQTVFYYDGFNVVFDRLTDLVVEVGIIDGSEAIFRDVNLFRDLDVLRRLSDFDGAPFRGLGVILFNNLGLALSGFMGEESPRSVGVFAKGAWDSLIPRLSPLPIVG